MESLFHSVVQANESNSIVFDFVCTDSSAASEDEFVSAGSKVIHITRPSKSFFKYVKCFSEVFRKGNYDIYHVNLTRFRFPMDVIIAKKNGVKVVLHCHSTQIYNNVDKKTQIVRRIEQVLFRPIMLHCSSINIACSKKAGEYLFVRKPFVILHNGINLDRYYFNDIGRHCIRGEFSIPEECKVIGHIGRFSIEKNHFFFLKVAKELIKKDDRYRFICVGDGELRKDIEKEAEKLGISKYISFPGQRSDIGNILSAMDLFLFPSIHEALPITLIEAQSNGLPCVVSDVITTEVDIGNMISRISLFKDTQEWAAIIEKTIKKRVTAYPIDGLDNFDIKKMILKLQSIYNEII